MTLSAKSLLRAFLALTSLAASHLHAQNPPLPKPTMANVPYGTHPKQVLDFYKAEGSQPTPLLFYIHGGGWMSGDKNTPDFLVPCLKSGISVVSIEYRFLPEAIKDGVYPPVKACLDDSARALQFVRSKAKEWGIDKDRIAGCGGSAGGFNTLWLAYHADLANPKSADPIARESTRLRCAVTFVPQTSLDPKQMTAWIPNNQYGGHAFSTPTYQAFLDKREEFLPWIREFSPYELVKPGAPPVYLFYDSPVALGEPWKDPPHSANFGAGLVEKLKAIGVEYEFNYTGATGVKHPDIFGFLLEKLQVSPAK